jgi:hypothetical protein
MILKMFRASLCSSSGGQFVYLQYLVSSHSVCRHTVQRLRADCSPLLIDALDGGIQSVTISDTVNIRIVLLKMSTGMLETC